MMFKTPTSGNIQLFTMMVVFGFLKMENISKIYYII
jgi:hypothetical protein